MLLETTFHLSRHGEWAANLIYRAIESLQGMHQKKYAWFRHLSLWIVLLAYEEESFLYRLCEKLLLLDIAMEFVNHYLEQ